MTELKERHPPGKGSPLDIQSILASEPTEISLPRMNGMDDGMDLEYTEAVLLRSLSKYTRPAHASPRPATPSQPRIADRAMTTPPACANFTSVNVGPESTSRKKRASPGTSVAKKAKIAPADRPLAPLAPAPPRPQQQHPGPGTTSPGSNGKSLYDIPAEIRVEIYKLVLANVTLHILPTDAEKERRAPHTLTKVSRLVRNEVLPIIHASCPIIAEITDFNFSGILDFLARIPPQDERALMKNNDLKIQICTTNSKSKAGGQVVSDAQSFRTWLSRRADTYRSQPKWKYCGVHPGRRVESDMRRRLKRMTEDGKKKALLELAHGIGLSKLEAPAKEGESS